jgi:hypothetical protein
MRALRAKHPALAPFLRAATTALVSVGIEEALHVGGFQRVTAWRPAYGAAGSGARASRPAPGSARREQLEKVARRLLEVEVLYAEEFERLAGCGAPPGPAAGSAGPSPGPPAPS